MPSKKGSGHQRRESDIELVVRTMKEIEYWLSKQTTDIDLDALANDDQLPDLYNLIQIFHDYFEDKRAFHRLNDMRHIRNRLVHHVGYDRIRKFNDINRITSRRDYEDAYQLVKFEIPKAIKKKKEADRSKVSVSQSSTGKPGCVVVAMSLGAIAFCCYMFLC